MLLRIYKKEMKKLVGVYSIYEARNQNRKNIYEFYY
jgi:hypothetical protein